jgi:formylglycine-generating enzyme required for sulfatase activity
MNPIIIIGIVAIVILLIARNKKKITPILSNHQVDRALVKSMLADFIKVEGGKFLMGSPESEEGRSNDEVQHEVEVSTFFMQSVPVTQGLYQAVMGINPSHFSDHAFWSDLPIENVSWEDAQVFIHKLNEFSSHQYRLPTEAEWEYAARGGKMSKGYLYSGSDDLNEVAWYGINSDFKTHLVSGKKPNELGLYDMSGNVWEWCSDWYAEYRLDARGSINPKGADSGEYRVMRGGSWSILHGLCRVANRSYDDLQRRISRNGFRLVFSE